MSTLKEVSIEAIKRLPDDCSSSDIMYELHIVSQVMEGLNDAKEGKVFTTDELLQQVETWGR
ncbi:MAG: hypothetical protein HYV29_11530 [Ignavibacteriales bacterium]|nr:hypothetical protein [Ignavibacteriales bacterium]